MLVISTRGFYNTVVHRNNPTLVMVRARVAEDLRRLRPIVPIRAYPEWEIIRTPDADYAYRVVIAKEAWEKAVATIAAEMDYTSFHAADTEAHGEERANLTKHAYEELAMLEFVQGEIPGKRAQRLVAAGRTPREGGTIGYPPQR